VTTDNLLGKGKKKKKNEGKQEADPRRDDMVSAATAQDEGLSCGAIRPDRLALPQNRRS